VCGPAGRPGGAACSRRRAAVDIDAVLNQESHHVQLAEVAGDVQRRVTRLGLGVHLGLVLGQDGRHVHAVLLRAQVQRRQTVLEHFKLLEISTGKFSP